MYIKVLSVSRVFVTVFPAFAFYLDLNIAKHTAKGYWCDKAGRHHHRTDEDEEEATQCDARRKSTGVAPSHSLSLSVCVCVCVCYECVMWTYHWN